MLSAENTENLTNEFENDLQGKDELVSQILIKFDLLLDRQEYYNYQERLYKLNKAITSISRAKNLSVSNFTESSEKSCDSNSGPLGKLNISLESLSRILDDLIKEKEMNMDDNSLSLVTSSSEEENKDIEMKFSDAKIYTLSDKRRKLYRNLYNYELLLKTYFYEKTLNTEKESQMLEELQGNVTSSNYSTTNMSLVMINGKDSIFNTPLSKLTLSKGSSAKTLNFTPSIKKSFFEDKEIRKCIDKRRRSAIDQIRVNLNANKDGKRSSFKRRSFINEVTEKYSHSCNDNFKKCKFGTGSFEKALEMIEDIDDGEISQFNSHSNSKLPIASYPSIMDKRTSIFREKENFLTNIVENEEFGNLSQDNNESSEEIIGLEKSDI